MKEWPDEIMKEWPDEIMKEWPHEIYVTSAHPAHGSKVITEQVRFIGE